MIKKINHIGIAVKNLKEAIDRYKKLGFSVDHIEELPDFDCKIAFLPCGDYAADIVIPMFA